ncbi:MAG: cytochrome c [Planctomycetes bacterium]|nr:cytochrome c [Planctomycetota bacterium]
MASLRIHLCLAFALAAMACAFLAFDAREALAQDANVKAAGLDNFKKYCSSCHSIGGGKLVGPDLAGLKERAPSRDWAIAFTKDPKSQNDAYSKKIRADFNDVMSPQSKAAGGALDDQTIADIVDFIFAGGPGLAQKKLRTATAADIDTGRAIFMGEQRLTNGGPACISCHSIAGVTGLGGGTLASQVGAKNPDLTAAFNRNGGEAGLRAALGSPQFLVMAQVYGKQPMTEDEVIALTAFLGDASRKTEPDQRSDYLIIYGIVGAIALLFALDFIWIKRFRNVRKTLVGDQS